jgi:hypothetical protein
MTIFEEIFVIIDSQKSLASETIIEFAAVSHAPALHGGSGRKHTATTTSPFRHIFGPSIHGLPLAFLLSALAEFQTNGSACCFLLHRR